MIKALQEQILTRTHKNTKIYTKKQKQTQFEKNQTHIDTKKHTQHK